MPRFDSEQRVKLLAAAIPVFAEKGLDGASIRMVAEAAQVNSALIYYYFEDKNMLFIEAIREVIRAFLKHLSNRRRDFANGSERIAFLLDGIFEYYSTETSRMRLMQLSLLMHPEHVSRALSEVLAQGGLVPIEVITEGLARGELRAQNPLVIWWSLLGAAIFSNVMGTMASHMDPQVLPIPLPSIEERKQQILRLLTQGLVQSTKLINQKK